MRNAVNFGLFQGLWFAAVLGAARGAWWWGPLALAPLLAWETWVTHERGALVRRVLSLGVLGFGLDSILAGLGWLSYPGSWLPLGPVPPWIASLWFGFATLPGRSLGWLQGRPLLAVGFGVVGGPASYAAGVRLGATAWPEDALPAVVALAVEYGVLMGLLLGRKRTAD